MVERSRARRSPARYLAPLALAAAIATTYLIIHHGLESGTSRGAEHHKGAASHRSTHTSSHSGHSGKATKPPSTFYTVRPGDSLSSISSRTGVPVSTIQSLNRNLNPQALQVGQRLRLRR